LSKTLQINNFDLDLKYISEEKFLELQAHTVQPLDIVITKMGDPPGDVTIYPQIALLLCLRLIA
jgi:type I restriction enzyme S subunit